MNIFRTIRRFNDSCFPCLPGYLVLLNTQVEAASFKDVLIIMYSYCYISACMMEMMGKSAMYDVIHARKVICMNVHD